jgi:hypothetical protein
MSRHLFAALVLVAACSEARAAGPVLLDLGVSVDRATAKLPILGTLVTPHLTTLPVVGITLPGLNAEAIGASVRPWYRLGQPVVTLVTVPVRALSPVLHPLDERLPLRFGYTLSGLIDGVGNLQVPTAD